MEKIYVIEKKITMKDGSFFTSIESISKTEEQLNMNIDKANEFYNKEKIQKAMMLLGCNISMSVHEIMI
jgi:hypothetical protein